MRRSSRQANNKNFRLSIALFGLGTLFTAVFAILELYVFLCVCVIMMQEFIFLIIYYYSIKHIDNQKRVKYLQWSQKLTCLFQVNLFAIVIGNLGIALLITIQLIEDRIISIPLTQTVLSRVGPSYYIFFLFNVLFASFNIHYLRTKKDQAKKVIFQIENPSFISAESEEISYDSNKVHTKSQAEEICAVCLENYVKQNKQITLPCEHKFHEECIKEVLTYKRSCPVCRAIA